MKTNISPLLLGSLLVSSLAAAQPATTTPPPAAQPAVEAPPPPAAPSVAVAAAAPASAPAPAIAAAPPASQPAAVPAPAAAPPPVAQATPEQAKPPSLKLYGFARLDATYDTGRLQDIHYGMWARSPDEPGADVPEFVLSPRWSRVGVDFNAGDLAGKSIELKAKVEADFHGGGSESRATPRLLQAYGEMVSGDLQVLGGQAWDLFSPLMTGGLEQVVFWYGGNLGDRRAQLRATYQPKFGDTQLVVAAALVQSGAVDMRDLDGDTVNDGIASGRPGVQGLLELRTLLTGKKPIRVGASVHDAAKRLEVRGEDDSFEVWAVSGHAEIPISLLTLRGEIWTGDNVDDLRGGIGQGLRITDGDTLTPGVDDAESLSARGGWVHLQVDPAAEYTGTVGYGRDSVPDVGPGGRSLNQTFFVSNVFRPLPPLSLGLVYNLYVTDYRSATLGDATVHRFCGYTSVAF